MNHADFHKAVRAIANGVYFTTVIEASESSSRFGQPILTFEFKAYIDGPGWKNGPTAESVLMELLLPKRSIDDLDAMPELPAKEPAAPSDGEQLPGSPAF
ncbi:MAG TPA: hypothetical protein VFT22_27700 [Kofleriaceae bacterium]|nr:hypothetical protein [Kofleriaceae bacterium]